MASFFAAESPQYIGPAGTTIATKTGGSLFGMFLGSPDYAQPGTAAQTTPPAGTPPVPPAGTPPVPPVLPQGPGIEVMIRVPGLLHLQGVLCVPPWLLESAPALLPLMLHILRQRLERELCDAAAPANTNEPPGAADDPSRERGYGRPDTEQRVWDRD